MSYLTKPSCCFALCLGLQASLCNFALSADLTFVTELFEPFVIGREGSSDVSGPLPEIVQATCKKIYLACKVTMYPWRRADDMAIRGEVDGIFPLVKTAPREDVFAFSDALLESKVSFFVLTTSRFRFSVPHDLDGLQIGVYGPSAASIALQDTLSLGSTGRAFIELSNLTVLRMLSGGRYGNADSGVAIMNRDVGLHILKSERITNVKLAGDLKPVFFSVGFNKVKTKAEDVEKFNTGLRALQIDGSVQKILNKYGIGASH